MLLQSELNYIQLVYSHLSPITIQLSFIGNGCYDANTEQEHVCLTMHKCSLLVLLEQQSDMGMYCLPRSICPKT